MFYHCLIDGPRIKHHFNKHKKSWKCVAIFLLLSTDSEKRFNIKNSSKSSNILWLSLNKCQFSSIRSLCHSVLQIRIIKQWNALMRYIFRSSPVVLNSTMSQENSQRQKSSKNSSSTPAYQFKSFVPCNRPPGKVINEKSIFMYFTIIPCLKAILTQHKWVVYNLL